MQLKREDHIVFFGDSITEWGRDKADPTSLGHGYANFVAGHLAYHYPQYAFTFSNRGIGGDKVANLNERIQECLNLKPDMVILMVGINDVWHNVGQESFGSQAEQDRFEQEYRKLLTSLKMAGVERILVMEPFVLPYPLDRQEWRVDLDPKIQIVRRLVQEFDLELVPLDGLLNEQAILHSAQYLTGEDGVHPTLAGAAFIGNEVLKRLECSDELDVSFQERSLECYKRERELFYKQLNQTAKENQIVFLGSSLMEQFPLQELNKNKLFSSILYNRAIGGYTSSDLLANIDDLLGNLSPRKVFINIGTNDLSLKNYTVEGLVHRYQQLLDRIRQLDSKTEIFILSYFPCNENLLRNTSRTNEQIQQANEALQLLAIEQGYHYLDVNEGLLDLEGQLDSSYTVDGIHLLPEAYQLVFTKIEPHLS